MNRFILFASAITFSVVSSVSFGQISLNTLGSPYTQDFNSLANTGTSTSVPAGWAFSETGSQSNSLYTADDGNAATFDTYSYGPSGNSERSFGVLSGSTTVPFPPFTLDLIGTVGVNFTNNTGATIQQLQISYTGEMWRLGTQDGLDRLDFQYSTDASSLSTGTWIDVNQLDFNTPDTSLPLGPKVGNNSPNNSAISFTITGLNITNGSTFWIRLQDIIAPSTVDDGLAIDDFSLTPLGASQDVDFYVLDFPPSFPADATVTEGSSHSVTLYMTTSDTNPITADATVDFDLNISSTADGNDFVQTFPLTATFISGSGNFANQVITFTTIDDQEIEVDEDAIIDLVNASYAPGNATINQTGSGFGVGSFTITIQDNESPPFSFRSQSTGNWSSAASWEASPNGTTWTNAPFAPDKDNANDITVRNGNTVTILTTETIAVDELSINDGGTVTVNTGGTLELVDGTGDDIVFDGGVPTLNIGGRLRINTGATMSGATSGKLKITGGTYEHNRDGGQIYNADWQANSSLEVTGLLSMSPSGMNQNFYDVSFNNSGQSANVSMQLSGASTYQSLTLTNTNSNRLYFSESADYTLIVSGGFTVASSAQFALNNSTANGTLTVNGSTILSSTGSCFIGFGTGNATLNQNGALSLTAGTIDLQQSSGTSVINLSGNFNQSGGTMSKTGSGSGTINLSNNGLQTWTSTIAASGNVDYDILNGSILDVTAGSFLGGGGSFALRTGGGLLIKETTDGGIEVQASGGGVVRVPDLNRTFENGATITYQGAAAQSLGDGFSQASDVDLVIDNGAGVSLSGVATISTVGLLTLQAGTLSIGANTLTINGSVVANTGDLGGGDNANLTIGGSGTFGTVPFASGTNSLNNFTLNRSPGSVTFGSDLEIKGAFTHTAGDLNFNNQELILSGSYAQTTGGFIVNSTSSLRIQGSGAISGINASGTIGIFEVANANGASITSINIADSLILVTGAASGAFTMQDNSVIARTGLGTITGTISPAASAQYSVLYFGSDPITSGIELPSNTTDLFSLTNQSSALVTVSSSTTVNGDLSLEAGTLSVDNQILQLAGAMNVSGGINFGTSGTLTFIGTTSVSIASIPQFVNIDVTTGSSVNFSAGTFRISGNLTNNGTLVSTSSSVEFNGTSSILGGQALTFNNVTITGSLTPSSQTINVIGNWNSSVGTFNAALGSIAFNGTTQSINSSGSSFNNVMIGGSLIKTLASDIDISNDLNISSTLDVSASNFGINIGGNWSNSGTFTSGNGTVSFNSTNTQNITGSSITSFNNIDIGNTSTAGARVESNQNLTGTLTLTTASSKFDADGSANTSVFTLVSSDDNPATDGNIAAIPAGATYQGATTVQRYMSAEGGVWRYISTPVTGLDVDYWLGEFPITNGAIPCLPDLGGNNDPSLYYYNETVAGTLDNGWVAHPTAACTETIDPGTGYSAFMRASGGQITINNRGPIYQGDFNFVTDGNLTYTDDAGQPASEDGWNLLGNPYPSAIDWDAMWNNEGTPNLDGTMYIRDNPSSVHATWNASTSTGTNGGSKNVAIGQSFWVHATSSPSLTLNENEKTTDSHEFFRTAPPVNYLRIALSDGANRDETLIHFFDDALAGLDKYDAYKLDNDIFNLSTLMNDGTDMVINALQTMDCESNLNLNITNIAEGSYTLKFTELNSFTESIELYLVDNFVGENIQVTDDQVYDFEVTADEASYGSGRFSLLFSIPSIDTELAVQGSDVCDSQNAVVSIEQSELDVSYVLLYNGQSVSETAIGNGETLNISVNNLGDINGEYEIDVRGDNGCGSVLLTTKAIVKVEGLYTVEQVEGAQACSSASLTVGATGAPADGAYRWYETESSTTPLAETVMGEYTTPELINSTNYYVSIINSLGCEGERTVVEAIIINLEIPLIEIDTLEHGVYQLISSYDQGNQWLLNGEMVAGATAKTLVITEPGTYSVLVEQSGCSIGSDDYDYNDLVTGLSDELNDILIGIAPNPFTSSFELHIPTERFNLNKTEITIFDINGKIVYFNKKVNSENISIALRDVKNGIYLINIYDGETGVQQKLVKE